MKTNYCFIPIVGQLTAESKIFRVSVGISQRDQIKRQLIDCYSCDCGLFWRVWDDTTEFEIKCRMSQSPDSRFLVGRGLIVINVSVSQMYDAIINNTLDSLSNPPRVNLNYFRLNSTLSPRFFFLNQGGKKVLPRAYSTRKNLSPRPSSEDNIAALCFGLLVFLYWIGCLLEIWESKCM